MRITPACAGNTEDEAPRADGARDHPRMRGEHKSSVGSETIRPGSPPHARGTRSGIDLVDDHLGITPACAGNTSFAYISGYGYWDHPRMRGEHIGWMDHPVACLGSPPHARGTLHAVGKESLLARITPACAGNTTYTRM